MPKYEGMIGLTTGVIDIHQNGVRHYPNAVNKWIHDKRKEGYFRPEELVLYVPGEGLDFSDVWIKMEVKPTE